MTVEVFEVFGPSAGCDEETRAISAGVKTEQSAVIRPGLRHCDDINLRSWRVSADLVQTV